MKLKIKKPFLAKILRLKFKAILNKDVAMVWGDTIYTYYKMLDNVLVHEKVHIKQQRSSKFHGLVWWIKYVFSVKYRLKQEREAYQKQYQYFCRKNKNKMTREVFLRKLASDLSGSMYNNSIDYDIAKASISTNLQ